MKYIHYTSLILFVVLFSCTNKKQAGLPDPVKQSLIDSNSIDRLIDWSKKNEQYQVLLSDNKIYERLLLKDNGELIERKITYSIENVLPEYLQDTLIKRNIFPLKIERFQTAGMEDVFEITVKDSTGYSLIILHDDGIILQED